MDKQSSLALFARGREAWNAWALAAEAELDKIVRDGDWTWRPDSGCDIEFTNPRADRWHLEHAVDFSYHEFTGRADFSGFIFPGFAMFAGAKFLSEADFSHIEVQRAICFNYASFGGPTTFADARIHSEAGFHTVKFLSAARFERVHILCAKYEPDMRGYISFSHARFNGGAHFSRSIFEGYANFPKAQFLGCAEFDGAVFRRSADLDETQFQGPASFKGASFPKGMDFSGALFALRPNLQGTGCRI